MTEDPANASFERLRDRLARAGIDPVAWNDRACRFVAPEWAGEADRLSGLGAAQHGGRWNPIGERAIYGSLRPIDATAEVFATARAYGFEAHDLRPRILFAFSFSLGAVLDLADGAVRRRLGVSADRLRRAPWRERRTGAEEAITVTVARAAIANGFEALRVDSAAGDGRNVVVFPDRLRPGSTVAALHPDRFP